jgi:phage tail sheath protein FI
MTYGRPGVYINETLSAAPVQSSGASAVAAGATLGVFAQGPAELTKVSSWYQFSNLYGSYNAAYPATFAVAQFFTNGGSELYVKRVLASDAAAASASIPQVSAGTMGTVTAKNKGATGTELSFQFKLNTGGSYNFTVFKTTTTGATTSTATVEAYTNLSISDATASNYFPTVVNNSSNLIVISNFDKTKTPAVTEVDLTGSNLDGTATIDGATYTALIDTDGSSDFDQIERPLVIFAAGVYDKLVYDAVSNPASELAEVQSALASWADAGNGYAILDTEPGLAIDDALEVADALPTTSQAAVYYPNYFIKDPSSPSPDATRKIGPAGAVAGIYMRTDGEVGPFKSPAGLKASVQGAIALERAFSNADLDSLNSADNPINAIRNIPGSGVTVMGARTLLQDGTANRYVSMRRSLIYIEKRLSELTQFALFENNNYQLWSQLRGTANVFLNQYFNQGGLRGLQPSEAFYIKVDDENNPASSISQGVVNMEIGLALEYPAEFIVINITQITGA